MQITALETESVFIQNPEKKYTQMDIHLIDLYPTCFHQPRSARVAHTGGGSNFHNNPVHYLQLNKREPIP